MHRKKTISFGILTSRDGYYFRKVISVSAINYSKEFTSLCRDKSKEKYKISDIHGMHERTETEICNAVCAKSYLLFLAAHEVIDYCKIKGIPYGCGFSSKFYLLAYYLGITEVNPLPVHYKCVCGNFELVTSEEYPDGFDLPDKECPFCNKMMQGDGHNLTEIEDDVHSVDIPVKAEFRDEIITHLKEKFKDLKIENLKYVDPDNICHKLRYSLSVFPSNHRLPEDCFTENVPFGILILSDYQPLIDFSLLSHTTNTDLPSIKFNNPQIYSSFYHYEEDVLDNNSLVMNFIKLPQDFYMIEKATCFSEFVCRLGLTKILPEFSYKSYDNFLRWLNEPDSGFYCVKENVKQIPYCIEKLVEYLHNIDLNSDEIKRILKPVNPYKTRASDLLPSYIETRYWDEWHVEIVDHNRFLQNKHNLIAEAMEIYRTQYFAENYPLQFFKCKINEMRK